MKETDQRKIIKMIAVSTVLSSVFTTLIVTKMMQKSSHPDGTMSPSIISKNYNSSESNTVSLVKQADQSVVSIIASKEVPKLERVNRPMDLNDPFSMFGFGSMFPQYIQNGTEEREIGGGSGFFVSTDGMIVTNKHVVADNDATYVAVLSDGTKYDVTVIGTDPVVDIAVLKLKNPGSAKFTALSFGDSTKLELGQDAIAIGNALGEFKNSISKGIISGLTRSITASDMQGNSESLDKLIQTDAAINTGNSGGPLLDSSGMVIGVNVAVAQGSQNIGFAIPSNVVKDIVDSVAKTGKIVRPFLGVRYIPIDEHLKKANNLKYDYGVLVQRSGQPGEVAVIPGSPADKAGIVENDIILEVDGEKITDKNTLSSIIRGKKIGVPMNIKISHQGKEETRTLTLDKAPDEN